MANYLALIRKADFVDLFKYGSLHVNRDMIRQFSCKVEDLPNREPIFNDLTFFANAFDSTFEYLFIHYESLLGRANDVNIANVRGIYPLDYEARTELSLTLDPRIKINNPLWPDAVFTLQKRQSVQNCKNGVSNIWNIYKLSDSIDSVNAIITDTIIKEIVDELYENRRPSGDLPIWVYLMRYERHAFYPNNTIGAFMDTVNAIFNYHQKREVDSAEIESTMIMQFLYYCNEKDPNMQFSEVLQRLYSEPKIANFVNLSKSIESKYDIIIIATLFYIYRNRYKEEFEYEPEWERGKANGIEFSISCFMLGCILGHEHTYDCLYEHLPLEIFESKKVEPVPPTREANANIGDKEIINETSSEELDKGDKSPNEKSERKKQVMPKLPCVMGVPKKRGGFKKSPKPQEVRTLEKYLELREKGWEVIKEDKKLW